MSVTKEDLRLVVTEIVSQLSAKIDGVRTELRSEIASVRTELGAEIASVRTELGAEIASVRTELGAEIASVRTELAEVRSDITELRHVTSVNHYKVIGRIDQVASMLAEHMADPNGHPQLPDRKRA